jgi:membrane-associated protease RseP (regulator of RpoE activity)
MDAAPSFRRRLPAACVPLLLAATLACAAADELPPSEPAAPPAFTPGDISIGEPIPLPFSPPPSTPVPAAAVQVGGATAAPLPANPAPAAPAAVPGTGWVGLRVAESNVPGRWRVEDVTPGGPAARAGIVVGDELRAINGIAITSGDAVAEALTAIAAGQDVRVAVARGEGVQDVALRAEPRPAAPPRDWQPAATARADEPPPATPPAVAAFATAPPQVLPPPALEPRAALPAAGAAQSRPASAGERGRAALGVRTVPIDAATQARFRLPAPAGAYVIGVVQDLPAAKAGVPPGSVIVALGDQPVRSPVELTQLVTAGPVDQPVSVEFVMPGGESRRANVVLQPLEAPLEAALRGPLTPSDVPTLGPGPAPVRAERPTSGDDALRAEIRSLRARLELLERAVDASAVRRR